MRTIALCFFLLSLLSGLSAQMSEPSVIHLRNPSFEDIPRNSRSPVGWNDCGFPAETPPDVHPDPMNQFQVGMGPQNGRTYLGMVVRDNDTWESVGQELSEPLEGGQCYDFRISLARSRVYLSQSRVSNRPANYVTPTKLRIHAGYDFCDRLELIGETTVVSNYDWQEYAIKLSPTKDYTHLVFEVFYKTPTLIPYNGNLLLDNASALVPMECDEEPGGIPFTDPVVSNPDPPINPVRPPGNDPVRPPTQPTPKPEKDSIMLGSSKGVLALDAIFQVPDITFKANEAELLPGSMTSLQEIIDFMTINDRVAVEIGGHASRKAGEDFANRVSLERAEAVVEYLRSRGVDTNRLIPKGYGKTRPVCLEDNADCKRKNQRVEVKIVGIE